MKESETEKQLKVTIQDNYRRWIIRLKNEKIFNLYECEQFLSKFCSDIDVENDVKVFAAFDADKNVVKKTSTESLMKEEYWVEIEAKSNSDEGATSLRKDTTFSDRIVTALKTLVYDERINDKKLVCFIVKILFNVLTKGKFEKENIDITKNQNILNIAMVIFKVSQNDESMHILLNDVIKVIGLFAKFYCYYSSGIDLSFCSGFLRYVPIIINQSSKPSNIHINLIKAMGIMITAANMVPKRSIAFYRSISDFGIINVLFSTVKTYYKTSSYELVKSVIECLTILINPMNGDVQPFPISRNENIDNKYEVYNEYKTTFSTIEGLRRSFIALLLENGILEILPILYELDNQVSLKLAILKIILQILRLSPKEIMPYLRMNSPYVGMINNIFENEEIENKLITQLGYLILIEVVKHLNSYKM